MPDRKSNTFITGSLLFAIFLWGGNNAGTKHIVAAWPPVWTGGSRFLCAGLLLLAVLRFTRLLGQGRSLPAGVSSRLWLRGGLSLAVYIVVFNWALRYTAASHVALYLGASPIWALVWEAWSHKSWGSPRRYLAALLGLTGVFVLFRPALAAGGGNWRGELLGVAASLLWTNYGHQCRILGSQLSGAETSAHSMWRAGLLLLPLGALEIWDAGSLPLRADLVWIQLYCIVAGGVVAFAIWSSALRHWPTSQVLLFNNLIPLSTMSWAHFWLGEPVTASFWIAMLMVIAGVLLGQTNWERFLSSRAVPPE